MAHDIKRFISLRHQFAVGVACAVFIGLSGLVFLLVDSYRTQRVQLVDQIQSATDQSLELHLQSLYKSTALAAQFYSPVKHHQSVEEIASSFSRDFDELVWLFPLINGCIDSLKGNLENDGCYLDGERAPIELLKSVRKNYEPDYVLDCHNTCTMWVGVPVELVDGDDAIISLNVGLFDELINISRQLDVAIELFVHRRGEQIQSISKFGNESTFEWLGVIDTNLIAPGGNQKFDTSKADGHSYISHSVEIPLDKNSSLEWVFVKQWDEYDVYFSSLVKQAIGISFAAIMLSIGLGYLLTATPLRLLKQHVQQLPRILERRSYHIGLSKRKYRDEFNSLDSASRSLLDAIKTMRRQIHSTHEKLIVQANTDALTGLGNRHEFSDSLRELINASRHSGEQFYLIYIDVDNFKTYNDGFGHEFGDELLIQIAHRMREYLPHNVQLFRIGSDEFHLIMRESSDSKAYQSIFELKQHIAAEMAALHIVIRVQVSVGIVSAKQADFELQSVLKYADLALQSAKSKGRNRIEVFTPDLEIAQQLLFSIETQFQSAMDNDELELFLQPQVCFSEQRVLGFELLLRWNHPTRGLLAPGQFLDVIENSRFVIPLGYWVIAKTLEIMCRFESLGHLNLSFALNVSAKQFDEDNFARNLVQSFQNRNCKTNTLEIELTESCAVNNYKRVSTALRTIRNRGIHVALDDFGKGFTSLSYLSNLPCDKVKFDREFCIDAMHDKRAEDILLHAKGLVDIIEAKVLVEGVETIEYARWLGEHGFDLQQGYGLGRPMPEAEAMLYLEQANRKDILI